MFNVKDYEIYNTGEFNEVHIVPCYGTGLTNIRDGYFNNIGYSQYLKVKQIQAMSGVNDYHEVMLLMENVCPIAVTRRINEIGKSMGLSMEPLTSDEYDVLYEEYGKDGLNRETKEELFGGMKKQLKI